MPLLHFYTFNMNTRQNQNIGYFIKTTLGDKYMRDKIKLEFSNLGHTNDNISLNPGYNAPRPQYPSRNDNYFY